MFKGLRIRRSNRFQFKIWHIWDPRTVNFSNWSWMEEKDCPFQFSHSVMSDFLWPLGLQDARTPCPSPTPGAYSSLCPSSWWCHPTISSSFIPFCCLQSFPASASFPMSQLFTSGGQSIGAWASASASILPMNTQGWFPLGLTGLISLQSRGLSRIFSSSTVWKHQFFDVQPS